MELVVAASVVCTVSSRLTGTTSSIRCGAGRRLRHKLSCGLPMSSTLHAVISPHRAHRCASVIKTRSSAGFISRRPLCSPTGARLEARAQGPTATWVRSTWKDRATMKVWIDQDLCTGDGLCEEIAPDVFTLLDDGLAYVKEGAQGVLRPGRRRGPGQRARRPGRRHDRVRRGVPRRVHLHRDRVVAATRQASSAPPVDFAGLAVVACFGAVTAPQAPGTVTAGGRGSGSRCGRPCGGRGARRRLRRARCG